MDSSSDEPQPKRQKTVPGSSATDQDQLSDNHRQSLGDSVSSDGDGSSASDGEEVACWDCARNNSDSRTWLKNTYRGTDMITVRFQSEQDDYYFPKEVLIRAFGYFKAALRSNEGNAFFQEGQTKKFHLMEVSSADFGICLRWATCTGDPYFTGTQDNQSVPHPCNNIHHVLEVAIAAAYLDQSDLDSLAKHLRRRLEDILLGDRCLLSLEHIQRVQTHPAFSREPFKREIMGTFVDAAVRPILEQYILDEDHELDQDFMADGSFMLVMTKKECGERLQPKFQDWTVEQDRTVEQWVRTIKHFISLTSDNHEYAAAVLKRVGKHIAYNHWDGYLEVRYQKDPLGCESHRCGAKEEECKQFFAV